MLLGAPEHSIGNKQLPKRISLRQRAADASSIWESRCNFSVIALANCSLNFIARILEQGFETTK